MYQARFENANSANRFACCLALLSGIGVVSLLPSLAEASCGDYVVIGRSDAAMSAGSLMAESLMAESLMKGANAHDESFPMPKSGCYGPNCRQRQPISNPLVPPTTLSSPELFALIVSTPIPNVNRPSHSLFDPRGRRTDGHSRRVDRPPRQT